MNKFDLSTYQAFGEAGYTTEQSVDEIHKFYEDQASRLESAAERKGYERGEMRAELVTRGIIGTVVATIALGLMSLPIYFNAQERNDSKARTVACASGDTVGCYEAVNFELRHAINAKAEGRTTDEREYRDDAAKLLLAYRQKTGTILPTK